MLFFFMIIFCCCRFTVNYILFYIQRNIDILSSSSSFSPFFVILTFLGCNKIKYIIICHDQLYTSQKWTVVCAQCSWLMAFLFIVLRIIQRRQDCTYVLSMLPFFVVVVVVAVYFFFQQYVVVAAVVSRKEEHSLRLEATNNNQCGYERYKVEQNNASQSNFSRTKLLRPTAGFTACGRREENIIYILHVRYQQSASKRYETQHTYSSCCNNNLRTFGSEQVQ